MEEEKIYLSALIGAMGYEIAELSVTMHYIKHEDKMVPCDYVLLLASDRNGGKEEMVYVYPCGLSCDLKKWDELEVPSIKFDDLLLEKRKTRYGCYYVWRSAIKGDEHFDVIGNDFEKWMMSPLIINGDVGRLLYGSVAMEAGNG